MGDLGFTFLIGYGWMAVIAEIWLLYKINTCRKNYDYDKIGFYICLAVPLAVVAIYWIWLFTSLSRGFSH